MTSIKSFMLTNKALTAVIGGVILLGGGAAIGAAATGHQHPGIHRFGSQKGAHGGFSGGRQGQGQRGQGLSGTVKSITGSELVITAVNGDWTVTADESTMYRSGRTEIVAQDIHVGDRVRVAGAKDQTAKKVTARAILKITTPASPAPAT